MTKAEALKLVGLCAMNFPHMQQRDLVPTAELWHTMLGHLDYPIVEAAVGKVLSTARFWPAVAEILEAVASLQPAVVPDAEMAWAEALRNVQRVGYTGTPTWTHPAIGKVVDAMWGSWSRACQMMFEETVGVDRAQFLKMYGTITKREREDAILPPHVKGLAEQLAARLSAKTKALPDPKRGEPDAP